MSVLKFYKCSFNPPLPIRNLSSGGPGFLPTALLVGWRACPAPTSCGMDALRAAPSNLSDEANGVDGGWPAS